MSVVVIHFIIVGVVITESTRAITAGCVVIVTAVAVAGVSVAVAAMAFVGRHDFCIFVGMEVLQHLIVGPPSTNLVSNRY